MLVSFNMIRDALLYILAEDIMYNDILEKFNAEYSEISTHVFISMGTSQAKASIRQIRKSKNLKKEILYHLEKFRKRNKSWPEWLKVDFVTKEKICKFNDLILEMLSTRRNYIDFGVSFDLNWVVSFLPEVINANAFVRPQKGKDHKNLEIAINNINHYLKNYTDIKQEFSIEKYQNSEVIRFDTKGFFLTPNSIYELETKGGNKGIRKVSDLPREVDKMIYTATNYLKNELKQSGKYEYGRFPHFDRKINFYNILRHCSSTYALVEGLSYLNKDLSGIKKAIDYVHENAFYDCGDIAYIYDVTRDINEIKLGQNAAYIFAVVEYLKNSGPDECLLKNVRKVAEGILTMINHKTMETYHVLNYPKLSIKEKFRIIYYDGEAALALLRLYQLDKNPKWLETVIKLFDKFISQNYWQYHDHWLSYCTNELIKIKPEERYIKFGLDNVSHYLKFIYNRETTFPTFLEMLTSTANIVNQAKNYGFNDLVATHINEEYLMKTLHFRADYQRAGYFYPEIAMYFKNPESVIGSFFIKHHGYRVRIDDIEHYLSGYIQYQKLCNNLYE